MQQRPGKLFTKQAWLFLGFVILLSFGTYFYRYWQPRAVFWDENYHIASAQKYLHGEFFMEQHPPLGKMLIALGETIFRPNARTDQFLSTDYGTDFKNVSFVGYRFFSALLGWWTAILFFFVFLLITRDALRATLLSFLYIFDNALIVHLRGAMLEGPLLFFCMLMTLVFFLIHGRIKDGRSIALLSVFFGMSFALVAATKVLGLLFALLIPAVCVFLHPHWRRMAQFLVLAAAGFLPLYIGVWQIHFARATVINPRLPDAGYYQASPSYKRILAAGRNASLLSFPVMLRDSWKFVGHYNRGAPRLDLCKPDENGSPPYLWPVGARAINYRWETPDGARYRYLYLVANPVSWFIGLASVFLAAALLLSSALLPLRKPLQHPFLLLLFLGLYVAYFVAVLQIPRVLYLYHYFIPLLLSFVLAGLVAEEIRQVGRFIVTEQRRTGILLILAALVFLGFQFYRPLTYYEPVTDAQFRRRALFPAWELTCVKCARASGLVIPR